jgi:hypothetical protein
MAEGSRSTWAKRVERWKDSGLTAKEFAAEVGINAATLSHWKWRLDKEARSKSPREKAVRKPDKKNQTIGCAKAPQPVQFIEVASSVAQADARFEVELRGGRRLFVPISLEAEALGRLIAVLETRA